MIGPGPSSGRLSRGVATTLLTRTELPLRARELTPSRRPWRALITTVLGAGVRGHSATERLAGQLHGVLEGQWSEVDVFDESAGTFSHDVVRDGWEDVEEVAELDAGEHEDG